MTLNNINGTKKGKFNPRARIILELGDQLIRNERIALLELIKNAYDADASRVTVSLKNSKDANKASISVKDNGHGMDLSVIENAWMEPRTDVKETLFKERTRTKKYERLPIGEKGIGRFAAHKLGNVLELVTRKENSPEILIEIDWNVFKAKKYLSDVDINIIQRKPKVFTKGKTGTRLTIRQFRKPWSRGLLRSVYRSITQINDPFFSNLSNFSVIFRCADRREELKDLINPKKIKKQVLWYGNITLDGSKYSMDYMFTPWNIMRKKLSPQRRIINNEDILDIDSKKKKIIDLNEHEIGRIRLEIYSYDRDYQTLNLIKDTKNQLTSYLDENGGIKVYRDGIRIYNYGEKDDDWLELDIRRVNTPSKRLSNNIIIGAVFLDRDSSESLIEKTNREGFIENAALAMLKKALIFVIGEFEEFRYMDKLNMREIYKPNKQVANLESSFDELREKIREKIEDPEVRDEIIGYLDNFELTYIELKDNLLRSSGAGLSFSIVIHEIEKILKELLLTVDREESSIKIKEMVKRLNNLTQGFSTIISSGRKRNNDLKNIISQAIFNNEYRFDVHDIELIDNYSMKKDTKIRCYNNYVLMSIINIIDNSIYWLERKYGSKKGVKNIYISIERDDNNDIILLVADNGPGFSIPYEYARQPFASKKIGGMGLGLYIVDEIMNVHQGDLIFPEKGTYKLPKKIDGAVVGLRFRG